MNASGVYAATLSWASPASIDLDLYLTRAGCPVTQDSCVLVSSDSPDSLESITWPVRAGEQYWLTVHNYSGGATAFTIQHSIAGVSGAISPSAVSVDTVFTSHDSGGTVSK